MSDYDVIILGSGPGGYLAAERLAANKIRVALVEKTAVGRDLPQYRLYSHQDSPQ